jgi:hypothetical protein
MKTAISAIRPATALVCALLTASSTGFAAPCPKGAHASLNLKTLGCESSMSAPTISSGLLTASGVLKAQNSGRGLARISSVVANLQIRDGNDWITVSNAVVSACVDASAATCTGTVGNTAGAFLAATVPAVAGAFNGTACSSDSVALLPFSVSFPASQLQGAKAARIEFVVTHDAAVSGCANNQCVAGTCGYNRDILIRFGFAVPPGQ